MVVSRYDVETHDPEEGWAVLNRLYAPEDPVHVSGGRSDFTLRLSAAEVPGLHLARIRHTSATRVEAPPFRDFVTECFVDGTAWCASGGEELTCDRTSVVRNPTEAGVVAAWDDVDVVVLRVPMAAVERVAAESGGVEASELWFSSMAPTSEAAAEQWRVMTRFVHRTLETSPETLKDGSILLQQLIDMVAATGLAVFPNTTMGAVHRRSPDGQVAPAAVRRALDYIEEHAREPITLTDIAHAAGTSIRAVQQAFRRHLDTTPTVHLRAVRLEGAHRDLQDAVAGSGTTVAGTAAAWGFITTGRFAQHYRERYGVTPRRTLHS